MIVTNILLPAGPVPVLTHLLSRKELTPHEVAINACEVLFGGVDTVSHTMYMKLVKAIY